MSAIVNEEQLTSPQESQYVAYSVVQLLQAVLPSGGTTSPVQSRHDAQNSPDASPDTQEARNDVANSEECDSVRESAGADLWDLAQSEEPARVAIDNMALDILPRVVTHAVEHHQFRIAELLLGALANIMCHSSLAQVVNLHARHGI